MSYSNYLLKSGEIGQARLEIKNISISYGKNIALENISFNVEEGQNIALIGPNGAGKSTLFKALVGLLPLDSGKILIHGLQVGHHTDCVAYVPQKEEIDWQFPITVFEVVMMGRYSKIKKFKNPQKKDKEAVYESLLQMGIRDLAFSKISELSGGQQQKVFIARAIAQEPHILLMDEPFTGVDMSTKETILAFLNNSKKSKITVIVATHDLNMAAKNFEDVLLLNKKMIAYGKPSDVFTQKNLSEAFGNQVMFLNDRAFIDECCPANRYEHKGVFGD
ncbi:metal ABC transporter ATP-binding protein [bacterium]|nr:metal ABC transporter ATP-binding protein [bacterium]